MFVVFMHCTLETGLRLQSLKYLETEMETAKEWVSSTRRKRNLLRGNRHTPREWMRVKSSDQAPSHNPELVKSRVRTSNIMMTRLGYDYYSPKPVLERMKMKSN